MSRSVSRASIRRRSAVSALSAASAAALMAFTARHANAATLFWDPSLAASGTGSGGSGTWDLSTANWFNGSAGSGDIVWPNVNSYAEFAGATSGTVSLSASVVTQGLTFNTAGYTINTGSSNVSVGGFGINASTGGTTTLNGNYIGTAAQMWNIFAGDTLTLGGTFNSSITAGNAFQTLGGGTLNVTGTLITAGKSTFSGTNGVVNLSGTESLDTGKDYSGVSGVTVNVTAGAMNVNPSSGFAYFIGNTSNASNGSALVVTGGTVNVTTNTQFYIGDGFKGAAGSPTAGNGVLTIGGGASVATFNTGGGTATTALGNTLATGTINLNSNGVLATTRNFTAGSAGQGFFNFNGGTLRATGSTLNLTGIVATVLDGGAIIDTNAFNDTIASNLSSGGTGIGGLTKIGAGVLTLSGSNSFTGGTNISVGTLAVAAPLSLAGYATPGKVSVASGAILSLGYNNSAGFLATDVAAVTQNATFAAGSNLQLDVSSSTPVSYANNLGIFTNFVKSNTGTLTLSGTNTYTGTTTVAAGFLTEPSAAALGTTSGLVLGSGTALGGYSSNGSGESISLPITLGGTTGNGVIDASATGPVIVNSTVTSPVAGAKSLVIQGATTVANTLNSTLTDGASPVGLTKSGLGTWTVTGSNSYSGTTSVTAGTLIAGGNNAFGTGALSINGGGAANVSGGNPVVQLTGGITLSNSVVQVSSRNDPTTTTVSPQLQNVAGNNTITGNMAVVNTGGSGMDIALDSGMLTVSGNLSNSVASSVRPFYFYGAGNAAVTGNVLAGATTNQTAIIKYGTGTLTLSGVSNTFTGGTFIYGGTVLANSTAALGTGTTLINQSGGVLGGTGTTGGNVTLLAGGTITAGLGALASNASGKLGTGTLNVSGGQFTVKLNGAGSALATAGTGASGTVGVISDELVLGGLTFNGSGATLAINPVLLSNPAATGSYSYLIATAPTGSFTNLSSFTLNQTSVAVGTYALSTDANGDSLFLDFTDTVAAPEPTSLLLAGMVAGPLVLGRRRRRASVVQ